MAKCSIVNAYTSALQFPTAHNGFVDCKPCDKIYSEKIGCTETNAVTGRRPGEPVLQGSKVKNAEGNSLHLATAIVML